MTEKLFTGRLSKTETERKIVILKPQVVPQSNDAARGRLRVNSGCLFQEVSYTYRDVRRRATPETNLYQDTRV